MEEKATQGAVGVLKNVLFFLNVTGDVTATPKESAIYMNVDSKDSGILIGYKGENLRALQYLVNVLLRKEFGPGVYAIVDIGGYRSLQDRKILDLANNLAERVKTTGRAEVLRPMSPSERRLIHTIVAELPEVTTESTGEEPYRRVIIRKKI